MAEEVTKENVLVYTRGDVAKEIRELSQAVVTMLAPHSFSKFQMKPSNNIRDLINVSAQLGINFLFQFTWATENVNVQMVRCPQGPTLHFKLTNYNPLQKQKKLHDSSIPLVVLNGFEGDSITTKILKETFQNMLPQIDMAQKQIEVKRVILVNYDQATEFVDIRHYQFKNYLSLLSHANVHINSLSDFQSMEVKDEVAEFGPRLQLQLYKVESGLFEGNVLYHRYQTVSEEDIAHYRSNAEKIRKQKKQQELDSMKQTIQNKKKSEQQKEQEADQETKRKQSEMANAILEIEKGGLGDMVDGQEFDNQQDFEEQQSLQPNKHKIKRQEPAAQGKKHKE